MKRSVSSGALSLLEVLLTLGLISVVLAVTSGLLITYAQSTRAVRKSNASINALQLLSQSINSEIKGAISITTPAGPGATAFALVLQRVDPGVVDRLTYFMTPPNPPNWTPYDLPDTSISNDFLAEVTYDLNGTSMERAVRLAQTSGYQPASVIATQIGSFEVEWFPDDSLETRITADFNGVSKIVSARVFRRVRP